jgi:prepilin-type N-terminal cleavage/methylation domain-containing protein
MSHPRRTDQGFSMTEIILVIAIISILSIAAVSMLGNRSGSAVRGLMDNLEAALAEAHKAAVATGRDTAVVTWGSWTSADPFGIAYGDATITTANIQAIGKGLVAKITVPPDATVAYSNTVATPFFYQAGDAVQMRAHVVMPGSGDWTAAGKAAANGLQNQDITTVVPFTGGMTFDGIIADPPTNLLNDPNNTLQIGGMSQRFIVSTNPGTTLILEVVSTTSSGLVQAGGAMGLLVIQNNGNSIYKFYNPGVQNGDGKWRRI